MIPENIIAAVRSQEQANALSKLGVKVLQLDLTNESAMVDSLLGSDSKKISIIRLTIVGIHNCAE